MNDETTTRDDTTDMGVPMAPGEGPQGPEDAFDQGPKRGDYSGRTGGSLSRQIVRDPDGTIRVEEQG